MRNILRFNRKLVLEQAERVPDAAGGYVETWTPMGTIWADIRNGAGRERALTGISTSHVPYRIYVRAAPEGAASRPRAGQRFVEGARVFRIEAVADGDGTFLECFTKEEVLA